MPESQLFPKRISNVNQKWQTRELHKPFATLQDWLLANSNSISLTRNRPFGSGTRRTVDLHTPAPLHNKPNHHRLTRMAQDLWNTLGLFQQSVMFRSINTLNGGIGAKSAMKTKDWNVCELSHKFSIGVVSELIGQRKMCFGGKHCEQLASRHQA